LELLAIHAHPVQDYRQFANRCHLHLAQPAPDHHLLGRINSVIAQDLPALSRSTGWPSGVIAQLGFADRSLFAIGPATRGTFWEVTAIPDIRVQAASIAGQILSTLACAGSYRHRAAGAA
jgi:hypothetical protein